MICPNCGAEIGDNSSFCSSCGAEIILESSESTPYIPQYSKDEVSGGLCAVSFLLPVMGLVLYMGNRDNHNYVAKKYGMWALIGLCAYVLLFASIVNSVTRMF